MNLNRHQDRFYLDGILYKNYLYVIKRNKKDEKTKYDYYNCFIDSYEQ